ncbi:MAG: ribosomal L7Ae/L30e/S12e/Gadd45 family protein [Clostridia bacterium]|nr:ribosomal L7Ae/L30e/S12e/Gadd45 family protein [Clostridia bacterium]
MTDKLLSIIGLARRAGKISLGCDPALLAIAKHKTKLIVTAQDISKNTLSRITAAAGEKNVSMLALGYTKEQISSALGKLTAVFSVNDEGFAKQIQKLASDDRQL